MLKKRMKMLEKKEKKKEKNGNVFGRKYKDQIKLTYSN